MLHGRLTDAERAEVWVRWKRGEPQGGIARTLGCTHPTISKLLHKTGGFAPVVRRRAARVLTSAEREEISRGLAGGHSPAHLARQLGRARSTITREIARNGGRTRYRAAVADAAAWRRAERPKPCRLATSPRLRHAVARKLSADWAPEQIAGWLKQTYPDNAAMQISHEAIYRTLFVQARGVFKRELLQHLRRRQTIRRPRVTVAVPTGPLADAVSISERPAEAADRAVPGHWEGDLLCGTVQSQIATLVERQSRYVMLVRLPTKDATVVAAALARHVRSLPDILRRSLTWDRGRELAAHRAFTMATKIDVYFADPHSPWQRGSNENTNGLLRQYFPRGTDLSKFSQATLNRIARQLNQRPRKTLGFRTPADKLAEIVASTG